MRPFFYFFIMFLSLLHSYGATLTETNYFTLHPELGGEACIVDKNIQVSEESSIEDLSINNYPIIDGSDSTLPLRQILTAKILNCEYTWERNTFVSANETGQREVHIQPHMGWDTWNKFAPGHLLKSNTHDSYIKLINDKVDLIFCARSISRDEKAYADSLGVKLLEKPIAKDALIFIVNPANPVNSVTHNDIKNIYRQQIVNWNELGGLDSPITPYIRNQNSGSQEKFETLVMENEDISNFKTLNIGSLMMSPYNQLIHDPAGIGFTPYYFFDSIVASDTTKELAIDGIFPNKETIEDESYIWTTEVFAAIRADENPESITYRLFNEMTEPWGQSIVKESGYVPFVSNQSSLQQVLHVKYLTYSEKCVCINNPDVLKSLSIVTSDGKTVFFSKDWFGTVSLSKFSKGIYFVIACFDDHKESLKIIL